MVDGSSSSSIRLSSLKANGIRHRIATSGEAWHPLVMLLHGWPESWYSWRQQLLALSKASPRSNRAYFVCAPDMRGYGLTDVPASPMEYGVHTLCDDVIQIAKALGHQRFVVIGHDFGAYLAWRMAVLHPNAVVAVCGMSVPYVGLHSPKKCGPIHLLKRRFGAGSAASSNFHYMLHHNLPMAAQEYDKNAHESLYRNYGWHPTMTKQDRVPNTPEVTDPRMFPPNYKITNKLDARSAPGLWKRIPKPKHLPQYISASDIQYLTMEYQRTGFHGGLNWYRALDTNWELLTRSFQLEQTVDIPSLFIAGEKDGVIKAHGGQEFVRTRMKKLCTNLTKCVFLKNAGHWIQMECVNDVNKELLGFLDSFTWEHGDDRCRFRSLRSKL